MKGYIYSLHAKSENDIVYIGATFNPIGRQTAHRNNFPYYWYDCYLTMSIIEEVEVKDRRELLNCEAYWIQQFFAWGFKLRNYILYFGVDVRRENAINEVYKKHWAK